MARSSESLHDVIWNGEFCFVCEERYHDIPFDDVTRVTREHFEQVLIQDNRMPDLQGAPVASWLLARIARLAGRRFPFDFGEVIGSDGADYWIRFFCISKPSSPIGSLSCLGSSKDIHLSLHLLKPLDGEAVMEAFVEALLQNAADVARCRIVVQYTEMTDPEIMFHIPKAYGWDGEKYLNEGAPEHAVDPSEYE